MGFVIIFILLKQKYYIFHFSIARGYNLKYYLYNLYEAQNLDNTSEEAHIQINKQWEQNHLAYQQIFLSLEDNLPSNVFQHFNGWGFHDFRLVKIQNLSLKKIMFLQLNLVFILKILVVSEQKMIILLKIKNVFVYQIKFLQMKSSKKQLKKSITKTS